LPDGAEKGAETPGFLPKTAPDGDQAERSLVGSGTAPCQVCSGRSYTNLVLRSSTGAPYMPIGPGMPHRPLWLDDPKHRRAARIRAKQLNSQQCRTGHSGWTTQSIVELPELGQNS
jgi:hypothetical protein